MGHAEVSPLTCGHHGARIHSVVSVVSAWHICISCTHTNYSSVPAWDNESNTVWVTGTLLCVLQVVLASSGRSTPSQQQQRGGARCAPRQAVLCATLTATTQVSCSVCRLDNSNDPLHCRSHWQPHLTRSAWQAVMASLMCA
jgi:hypothetical protein